MSTSLERAVLDPSALLSLLPSLLPSNEKRLKSPTGALAALAHSIMTALEFRLVAVDDDSVSAYTDSNALPIQWSANPSAFTLRYKHNQSSLEFVIKVSRLGGRTLFNAITDATDKVASFDLQTADFTSAAAFPYDLETGGPLVHAFISSARVTDFTTSFKTQIVQKVIPSLRKDGYQERTEAIIPTSSSSEQRPAPAQPRPATPPQPFDPGRPFGMPRFGQPANPLEVGRRDREPLGGMFGPPGFGPPIGPPGGGMFVGPDDPLFHGGNAHPHRGGPWGGDGFLPPLGAPPGARFDPVGPFGGPPGAPRPPRQPRGDNDEFMPPAFGSDMII